MADIFHEVDEEVRREQLKRLWDRYSIYFIALAVLIVAGIGAWRGYEYWVAKRAAAAGAAFEGSRPWVNRANMPRRKLLSPRWQWMPGRLSRACADASGRHARSGQASRRGEGI